MRRTAVKANVAAASRRLEPRRRKTEVELWFLNGGIEQRSFAVIYLGKKKSAEPQEI